MSKPQRPLSPHLQVYKPQLTSMMSITHRLTGLFLSLGLVIFVYWLFSLAKSPGMANEMIGFVQTTLGCVIFYVWVFAFAYHLCNGIRHLFWDAGKGYSIPAVYRSGYMVILGAALLTALVYVLGR
ncbi:succinate dehydrogenase, cytochrome b556 subunit [Marinicella rhabdoformis]|uniref:succinate dehydrogenase, cytochrome b556 subunit n=1 Tax=Marinicella rhabdoformis TaxID=2580566 RepID=UPI0012AEB3C7|nr:succinate dehydrogenase, cytochrome b556 subunit [Marinicella rhabdoformis]